MSLINRSIILNSDSYKASHWLQLPKNTTKIYSYIESRGGSYKESIFFGIQAFIKEYLLYPITQQDIDFAEQFLLQHGEPFNREGWQYILDKHNGYLPVKIKAVKEGSLIPVHNVLVTVENTDDKCAWLTSYIETILLRGIWYPVTVATRCFNMLSIIDSFYKKTVDNYSIDKALFQRHSFGARGVSSGESAMIAGMAELLTSKGTDTIEGILGTQLYYNGQMTGFSIPASEHTIPLSWGKDNEIGYLRNMIKQFGKPGAIFAAVADTWDVYKYCKNILPQVKDDLITSGSKYVVRPDSGNPVEVSLKIVEILGEIFGYTTNSKGYKILHPSIGIIYGDAINEDSLQAILNAFAINGWASQNIAVGVGGYTIQMLNRDTMKFAMKASAAIIDGKFHYLSKNPITDPSKKSKAGILELVSKNGIYKTITDIELTGHISSGWTQELRPIFENGHLLIDEDFESIRTRTLENLQSKFIY